MGGSREGFLDGDGYSGRIEGGVRAGVGVGTRASVSYRQWKRI